MRLQFLLMILWSYRISNLVVCGRSEENPIKNEIQRIESEMPREKRQLYDGPINYPIYYDGQSMQTLQPVTLLTPATGNSVNVASQQQQIQQQPGFLPSFLLNNQNLPIIGTLVGQLPSLQNSNGQLNNGGLLTGLPGGLGNGLNGLLSGLGNLGGLGGLGGLGQLGNLGNLGNAGGILPLNSAVTSCPTTQKFSCRCEPLMPSKPLLKKLHQKLGTEQDDYGDVQIIKEESHQNEDGTHEERLILNNGLHIYKRSSKDILTTQQGQTSEVSQGFFALKYTNNRYFTISYMINDLNYTVKADITNGPPKTVFDKEKPIL